MVDSLADFFTTVYSVDDQATGLVMDLRKKADLGVTRAEKNLAEAKDELALAEAALANAESYRAAVERITRDGA